jgi:hypothetical protein
MDDAVIVEKNNVLPTIVDPVTRVSFILDTTSVGAITVLPCRVDPAA